MSISAVEVEVALPLRRREGWGIDYVLRVVPVARLGNNPTDPARLTTGGWRLPEPTARSSALGFGLKPLGLRAFTGGRKVGVQVEASAGILRFESPALAANASRNNFVLEVGIGVRVKLFRSGDVTVGIRRHHLSNAGFGEVNPGLNSQVLVLGLRLP